MKQNSRAEAAKAYVAAAEAYFAAYVELAAHDHANGASTFAGQPDVVAHAEFLQHPPTTLGNAWEPSMQRAAEIAAQRQAVDIAVARLG